MSSENLERLARNKNVARAAVRQLSIDQLDKLSEIIHEVIDQKRQDENERVQQEKLKEQKLLQIRQAMNSAGLSVDDLVAERPKRRGRPPKKLAQKII